MKKSHRIFPFLKSAFITGFWKISPFIIFIGIICWMFDLLLSGIEAIESLFPQPIANLLGLPEPIVKLLEIIMICIIILVIGIIAKQENLNKKLEKWITPIIHSIPLLGFLYEITNKVALSLEKAKLFKKAVYVETHKGIYEFGLLGGDSSEDCCEATGNDDLKVVGLPFYPPASMRVVNADPGNIKFSKKTVMKALADFIAFNPKQKKESHSDSEWDFF